jgi:hypothetical protein
MNKSYLSRSNVDELYGYMKNVIQTKKQIDLDQYPKYRKVLKKMMGMIYDHNGMSTSTIRELNALTVQKTGPYILDLISKDQPMLRNAEPNQKRNQTNTRIEPLTHANDDPMGLSLDSAFSQNDDVLLQSLYERESDPQRAQLVTTTKNEKNTTGQDFQSRLQEIEKSRGYSNNNEQIATIEEQQKEWRENIRKADDKAESEARSRHVVSKAGEILSVISQDNVPSVNGEFNQNTPFDSNFNQIQVSPEKIVNRIDTISVNVPDASNANRIGMTIEEESEEEQEQQEEQNGVNPSQDVTLLQNNSIMQTLVDTLAGLKQVLTEDEPEERLMVSENVRIAPESEEKIYTVILDTGNGHAPLVTGSTPGVYWDTVKYDLNDTLNFSTDVDVFLESLTINNPALAATGNMYLVVDFDFMNERSVSNNSNFRNRFVIPNENTSSSGANQIMKYHLKSNYIGRLTGTEKGSIRNITARFMNEEGNSAGVLTQVTDRNSDVFEVRVANLSATPTLEVTSTQEVQSALAPNDIIYTQDGVIIGTVSSITDGDGDTVVLTANPSVNLLAEEKIFVSPYRTPVKFDVPKFSTTVSTVVTVNIFGVATPTVAQIKSYGFKERIKGSSGEIVERGTIARLADGTIVGEITEISAGSLTFGEGIQNAVTVAGNETTTLPVLYTSHSTPVFSVNSKTNRIIMELILRERKESILTSN